MAEPSWTERRGAPDSAESGRYFFNALPRRRAEALQRRENPFVGHGRAEIRPAVRLKLRLAELILLVFVQLASGRPCESAEVETDLLLDSRVDKTANLEVLFDRRFYLAGAASIISVSSLACCASSIQ